MQHLDSHKSLVSLVPQAGALLFDIRRALGTVELSLLALEIPALEQPTCEPPHIEPASFIDLLP